MWPETTPTPPPLAAVRGPYLPVVALPEGLVDALGREAVLQSVRAAPDVGIRKPRTEPSPSLSLMTVYL